MGRSVGGMDKEGLPEEVAVEQRPRRWCDLGKAGGEWQERKPRGLLWTCEVRMLRLQGPRDRRKKLEVTQIFKVMKPTVEKHDSPGAAQLLGV